MRVPLLPRSLSLACALLLAGALGCNGCRSETTPPSATATATDAATRALPQGWLEGRLPPSVEAGTPVPGGTLTIRLYQEPAMLNPVHDNGRDAWGKRMMQGTVYETLVELDRTSTPPYQFKPLLAERWETSPDQLTHTFTLRKGVTFHDGQPFTSRDVQAVMDVLMNPANLAVVQRGYFEDLESYAAPDPHTFVLKWKRPYYYGFRQFATSLPILPHKRLEGDWNALPLNREPVGTGPFRFVSWESGKAVTLARNEKYWGTPAYLDRVVFRVARDHTLAAQLWEKGEFDLMTFIQPSLWKALERPEPRNAWAQQGYHRIRFLENNYGWIGWNQQRPFFKDARVRTALAHLFPADAVGQGIDLGLEVPTTCPYYLVSPYCDPGVKPLPYDPKRAAALLDEAGWKDSNGDGVRDRDGVPFSFTFLMNAHSEKLQKLTPILQEEYRRVGIRMDIERVEWSVFTERLRSHAFDAASLLWTSLDSETDLFQTFHSTQDKGSNYVSYKNPEVDALLVRARTEFDDARRTELARALHRTLYRDQVYNFLTSRPVLDAVKTHVRGLRPALNWYDLRKVWLAPPTP